MDDGISFCPFFNGTFFDRHDLAVYLKRKGGYGLTKDINLN
jgi:hypothetical protein